MKSRLLLTASLPMLLLILSPARAHHSFATHYDSSNIVEISGTITELELRSPHSFISVDVTNDSGSIENWTVESHARALLSRLNLTEDVLRVGDPVTVWGPRSRKPEKLLMFGAQYLTADGQEFEVLRTLRRPPTNAIADIRKEVAGLDRFTGRWVTYIEGQVITDSPMPLNEAGLAARAAFDPRDTPAMNCVPPNLPSILFLTYNYDITVDGNNVTLHQEYQDLRREVTVGSAEPNTSLPEFGHRTATFDGNTLVITSTNFPALRAGLATGYEPNGNGADIPSSTEKVFTERYSVNDDGSLLVVDYVLEDPVYLTEPYESRITWHRVPREGPLSDVICDPVIARRSTLNAVREDEVSR